MKKGKKIGLVTIIGVITAVIIFCGLCAGLFYLAFSKTQPAADAAQVIRTQLINQECDEIWDNSSTSDFQSAATLEQWSTLCIELSERIKNASSKNNINRNISTVDGEKIAYISYSYEDDKEFDLSISLKEIDTVWTLVGINLTNE